MAPSLLFLSSTTATPAAARTELRLPSKKGIPIMSNDPKHPAFGDMALDASDVTPVLLTPEQIRRYSKVRPGFEKALATLLLLSPAEADFLGISSADLARAAALKGNLDRLDELQPAAEELVHRLHSTHLDCCHHLAVILHGAANAARRRAVREPSAEQVLGTLGELLAYVSEPSNKAAATRAKNPKAKRAPAPIPTAASSPEASVPPHPASPPV